mgnify:FL=1
MSFNFDTTYTLNFDDGTSLELANFEVDANGKLTRSTDTLTFLETSSITKAPLIIQHQFKSLLRAEIAWKKGIKNSNYALAIFVLADYDTYAYYNVESLSIVPKTAEIGATSDTIDYREQIGIAPNLDRWFMFTNNKQDPRTYQAQINLNETIQFAIDITNNRFALPYFAQTDQRDVTPPQAKRELSGYWQSKLQSDNFMQYTTSPYYQHIVDDINNAITASREFPAGGDPSTPDNPNAGQYSHGSDPSGIGDFDNTSDNIEVDNTTRVSAGISGKLLESYIITPEELSNLNDFLWSTNFADVIGKYILGDPMACITGIMSLPFTIPEVNRGSDYNISILNQDTGARGTRLTSLIAYIDCGQLAIRPYWGNFMDYNTDIQIYVPYCGTYHLDINEVMSSILNLSYKVDIMTGACVATLYVTNGGCRAPLYTFSGTMGIEYPLSSADRSRLISATMGALSNPPATALQTVATGVSANAPNIQHNGAYNGNSGALSPQQPYLIIRRQVQSLPESYSDYIGYPSNITGYIGNVRGFAKISDIHLNISCLSSESEELLNILHTGFYLL